MSHFGERCRRQLRDAQTGELVFHALAAPTADEVTEVASRTAERVQKVLARHGRTIDGTGESDAVEPRGEQLALAALCGAAAAGHGLAGDGAGEPFQRYDDEGVAVGDELSLGPAPTSPALIGGGSGTSLVGWGYIGDEELGEKSGLLMNGVGPDGALTGPGFAIEEETFSNTLIGSVVPTGSSFAVLWSGDQGAGFLTSFAKVSTQGALGAVTNVISSAPVHKMRRMVKTQAGFAVLFQGGIPADAVYVVLLDEDGIVVPPAHRYLGAKYALDLAVQGDEIGLLAVQQDDRPAFRPLGADGAVQGPWVCLTEPQFGAQAALDADGAGYAMVYRTPGGAVELLKTDSLGSGAP